MPQQRCSAAKNKLINNNILKKLTLFFKKRGWKTTTSHLFNIQTYNRCINETLINMIAIERRRIKNGGRMEERLLEYLLLYGFDFGTL